MQSANRVVVNTGFLYGKMLITMFISLYSTRLILNALGAVDYGIFNLVGGVIAFLSFLNGAMTTATLRYMSFSIGAGDEHKLKSIFSSSVILHLIIGLTIVLLMEFGGIFLFNGTLNIPADRVGVAKIVFHFMVVSTFFTINAVPYDAAINAHENFLLEALLGIFESVIKLGIAISLIYTDFDKLILYALLIAALTILVRIIKSIYCFNKYEECRIRVKSGINIELTKEMFSFAGWNLFGSLCNVTRNQGLAILLNLFFGVLVNAAYGIANQVNGLLTSFSTNMVSALNPQIVKSEGSGDRERMLRLAMLACKLSFFLLSFFAIPLIVEMPFILNIWLKTVPENTIMFCQLILVVSLIQQLTVGLMSAIHSVGKIKIYQTVMGSMIILNLPLAFGLIKIGFPAYSVLIGSILIEIIAAGTRICFAHNLVGLPAIIFLKKNVFNSVLSVLLATLFALLPGLLLEKGFLRVSLTIITSIIFILLFGKYISLTSDENRKIKELIISFSLKVNNKNRIS
jgi:O-antigen/teichoic acid export membrane protein